jgi:hypothetical protein
MPKWLVSCGKPIFLAWWVMADAQTGSEIGALIADVLLRDTDNDR